jgi:hypothetical protein
MYIFSDEIHSIECLSCPTHILVECRILLLVKREAPQPDQLNVLASEPMTLAHADQLIETRRNSENRSGYFQASMLKNSGEDLVCEAHGRKPNASSLHIRLRVTVKLIAKADC